MFLIEFGAARKAARPLYVLRKWRLENWLNLGRKLHLEFVMQKEIVLYSAKLCGDCQHLKAFMDANGIVYENRDIREHPEYGEELEARTGKLGVPYLVIDGQWVRGYEPGKPFSEAFAKQLLGLP